MTKTQALAMRIASRVYGVSVEEIQSAIDSPQERLLGFVGSDWITIIIQIMQVVAELFGDCAFGSRLLGSVRQPPIFARMVLRTRANGIFRRGHPAFSDMGSAVAEAMELEGQEADDEEIATLVNEIRNPNPHMVI